MKPEPRRVPRFRKDGKVCGKLPFETFRDVALWGRACVSALFPFAPEYEPAPAFA